MKAAAAVSATRRRITLKARERHSDFDETVLDTEGGQDPGAQVASDSASDSGAEAEAESGQEASQCAGLSLDACMLLPDTCAPVWGRPYQMVGAQWCVFHNGATYLECAEASTCDAELTSTVCNDEGTVFHHAGACELPAPLQECEPPAVDAPLC